VELSTLLFAVFSVLVLLFGFVVAFGAPYLPTLKPQITTALDMLDLKKDQTLLELGSGDGRVMVAAAERGLRVIGYELNPLLVLYSWLITRKYRGRVRVVWGNFWWRKLPQADGVFVFLLQKYMQRLDTKIIQEIGKPVKLVSFGFHISDRTPVRTKDGLFFYDYK
jgi:hypothetical protein